MEQSEQNLKQDKLKVDIYIPLNVCACQWEGFMNSVFQVLTDYKEYLVFETKNLNSAESRNLNLHGNSVVIDGKVIVSNSFVLKKKLSEILKGKGLI